MSVATSAELINLIDIKRVILKFLNIKRFWLMTRNSRTQVANEQYEFIV